MLFFDPMYFVFALPGLIFSLWATFYVKSTFAKYSAVASRSGLTGAEAARRMLDGAGVRNVTIERVSGWLSDHYDPRTRTLRLSEGVYDNSSLAAIGVACHEAGHALQHATQYQWLGLRTVLVPAAQIGSWAPYILFTLGMLLHNPRLILAGCVVFSFAVLFSVVTLPVEWDASARARVAMVRCGAVSPQESDQAWCVLKAAFMTYVAAVVTSLLTLIYYLYRAGLIGGRRED